MLFLASHSTPNAQSSAREQMLGEGVVRDVLLTVAPFFPQVLKGSRVSS